MLGTWSPTRKNFIQAKHLSAVLVAIFMLIATGCGGGGSQSESSHLPKLDTEPEFEPTVGSTADRVVQYLKVHASGGPWNSGPDYQWSHDPGLVRFATPPTVRLATGMTDRERAISRHSIALVNRALPYSQHLRIGPDAPQGIAGKWQTGLPDIPDGQMVIEFIQTSPQGGRPESEALGHQHVITNFDSQQDRYEKLRLRASSVEMSSRVFQTRPDWQAVSVLVHEMVHGLGFAGHPGAAFSDSIMEDAWFRLDGSLPLIDIAALQALYSRLPAKSDPEDISVNRLGTWQTVGRSLTDDIGSVEYGVRHLNNISVPFTKGPELSTSLRLSGLSGNVVWSGDLLGLTSDLQTVRGDSTISVNLANLTGTARFSDLKTSHNEIGSVWGDGSSFNYNIKVGSNYLYSTSGDDGEVSGQFYGDTHQYVGGTVERSDLTAAFGGERK